MNMKLISIVIALAVCGGALAQPKSSKGCSAPIYSRDFARMEIVYILALLLKKCLSFKSFSDF